METHNSSLGSIKTLRTRFLYPFFFQRQGVHEATKALLDVSLEGRDGQRLVVWECSGPHELYREEVLEHVVAFLFSDAETAGCRYLTLAAPVRSRWFGHLEARLPGDITLPVRLSTA